MECGNHDVVKKALDLESGKLGSSLKETFAILFSHPVSDPFFTELQNISLCKFERPDTYFPSLLCS